jgi:hypothetical protein
MNEAINNFNQLVNGQRSIKVDAKVPDSELLKIGGVLFLSYLLAFLFVAIMVKKR